jgi:hypothetical protein
MSSIHRDAISQVYILPIVILILVHGMIVIYHSMIPVHIQFKRLAQQMLLIAQLTPVEPLYVAKKPAIKAVLDLAEM